MTHLTHEVKIYVKNHCPLKLNKRLRSQLINVLDMIFTAGEALAASGDIPVGERGVVLHGSRQDDLNFFKCWPLVGMMRPAMLHHRIAKSKC